MDLTQIGYHIRHTMELLETSTKEHPNTVRIAIEGQSISNPVNQWTVWLREWLINKYPNANIEYRNFAIGGFGSAILRKRVPNDMKEFKPHLVILNVTGNHYFYEDIVKEIRSSGAELMIQTYHYTQESEWDERMSYEFMPSFARRYGCELCRVRDFWKEYIEENQKQPADFLMEDMTHLNLEGQKLMFEIMKKHFIYRPSNATTHAQKQLQISKRPEVKLTKEDWEGNYCKLDFVGTGIEILDFATDKDIGIRIDGALPSEIKDCYIRSCEYYDMWHTNLGVIRFADVPEEQEWTVEISNCTSEADFHIKAYGSKTGFEGEGDNILEGEHLILDTDSFILNYIFDFENNPGPHELKLTFKTILNVKDSVTKGSPLVVGGLTDAPHTIEFMLF